MLAAGLTDFSEVTLANFSGQVNNAAPAEASVAAHNNSIVALGTTRRPGTMLVLTLISPLCSPRSAT